MRLTLSESSTEYCSQSLHILNVYGREKYVRVFGAHASFPTLLKASVHLILLPDEQPCHKKMDIPSKFTQKIQFRTTQQMK